MANTFYDKGVEKFSAAGINWPADNIKAVLVDVADYAFSQSHEFLSDVPSIGRVATSANMTGKTNTGGVLDVADFAFVAATGDPSEAIIWYKDTGTAATSPLILYIDTATNLPVTPNGGDINIIPNNGADKLARL